MSYHKAGTVLQMFYNKKDKKVAIINMTAISIPNK